MRTRKVAAETLPVVVGSGLMLALLWAIWWRPGPVPGFLIVLFCVGSLARLISASVRFRNSEGTEDQPPGRSATQ